MSRSKRLLSVFFWFTFAAFLAPSVPHIAYFFHAWEPVGANEAEHDFWWIVSYAIAFSIDGTVIWLSRTAAVTRREKTASGKYLSGLWSFILFLTAVSWLINWLYAKHDSATATLALSGAISENIFGVSMGTVTPIMASMFPVLAIMFTLMADKVITQKALSAEELAQEADRLEALATEQTRLEAAKARMHKPSAIQRAKELFLEAKTAAQEIRGAQEEEGEVPAAPQEPLPEKLAQTLQFLSEHPDLADNWVGGADEQLAAYLGLNRAASARFWRLKALELWHDALASTSNQDAAPKASREDSANNGHDADTSEDETPEHTASGDSQQTSTLLGKHATLDDGKDRSEQARKTSSRAPARDGSATPLSVTVKEAATMLGLSESYVRELRNNKRLRSPGRNKKLLLVSSIKAYQETRQKPELNEQHLYQENALRNGNGNGEVEAAVSLGEYPQVTA
jgi:Helix-turn-helix domain